MGKYDSLKPRLDVHQVITAKIVERIEQGAGEFQMPRHRPGLSFAIPKNALTGQPRAPESTPARPATVKDTPESGEQARRHDVTQSAEHAGVKSIEDRMVGGVFNIMQISQ